MKIQNRETREKMFQRLRRIEGQVRGVQDMLRDERDCREIMQQLSAIHSAVQATSRIFLQDYATACLTEVDAGASAAEAQNQREKVVREMLALLDKTP